MKITNAELFNVKEPLLSLVNIKLPVKASLAVLKLVRKLNEHLIPAEEVKDNLIKQYGSIHNPNKPNEITVQSGDENFPKFAEDFGVLCNQSVEIVIDIVELPDTLEIEPAILMALEKFIKVA